MATRNFSSSAAQTSLSAGISGANTSIQVASTTGFPAAPFILALDAGASAQELVLVTAVAGTTLTVTRGYDSTVATTHDAGATVVHSHGGIDFREANSHVNANSGVHGVTGSVVGTTDTQTLTNKTLTAPAATGSLASFGGAWTAYAPTVTGFSVGAGSTSGRYIQIGKIIHFRARAVLGAGFSISGGLGLSIPVTASSSVATQGMLSGVFTDAGSNQYAALTLMTTTHAIAYALGASGAAANPTATTPFTWAATDEVVIAGSYEAA